MSGIGYKHIGQYLQREMGLEEAVLQMKHDTPRPVCHQYAWFRSSDKAIHWFDVREAVTDDICKLVRTFISKKATLKSPKQAARAQK